MKNRCIKICLSIILGLVCLIFSVLCYNEAHVTTVLTYHDSPVYLQYSAEPLTPSTNIRGEFIASNNYLATVKLRIRTFNRMNTTHIRFLLREKGEGIWSVINTYTIDRFTDGLLYPFGFPVIEKSKGKIYEFQIESIDGKPDNSIGITNGYHAVATQYVFNKSLLRNPALLKEFIIAKLRSTLSDPYAVMYFVGFLVPLYIFISKRYTRILTILLLILYTYLPVSLHANTILFIAATLLGTMLYRKIPVSIVFTLAVAYVIQIPITILFGNILAADRLATLVFFLLVIGVIISLKDLNRK